MSGRIVGDPDGHVAGEVAGVRLCAKPLRAAGPNT